MDKRLIPAVIVITAALVLGILAYANLEIYPRKVYVSPSREALSNDYHALECWLEETGHPVRVERRGGLSRVAAGPEKVVLVQASAREWENSGEILLPWIKGGGFLVISVDHDFYDEDLDDFFASLGISVNEYETESLLDDTHDYCPESPVPDFDRDVWFFVDDTPDTGAKIFTIQDPRGIARLVQISLGKGTLTVTGQLYFMSNDYLDRELNARLAWDLTGARAQGESPGLLFIRDNGVTKGFFGKIADQGNFLPLVFSVLLLAALGFWMTIPVFGLVFCERRTQARPIRERFLAETRFLKKYGGLESYLETYISELKSRGKNDAIPKIAEIEQAMRTGRSMKYRDILTYLRKLSSMVSSKTGI